MELLDKEKDLSSGIARFDHVGQGPLSCRASPPVGGGGEVCRGLFFYFASSPHTPHLFCLSMFAYDPTTPLESPACDQRKGKERDRRKQKSITFIQEERDRKEESNDRQEGGVPGCPTNRQTHAVSLPSSSSSSSFSSFFSPLSLSLCLVLFNPDPDISTLAFSFSVPRIHHPSLAPYQTILPTPTRHPSIHPSIHRTCFLLFWMQSMIMT